MDVMEAIRGRRTVHNFTAEPIPREHIETMLEAAIWAPNHKLTNPWEFYVISGEAKEQLAKLRGELKRSKFDDPQSPQAQRSYERAYGELATVPYAVLVCQKLADDENRQAEDRLAVACAIQNLLLAAHSIGIGTYWGTGPVVNHAETFRVAGVPTGRTGVGLILVGRAEAPTPAPSREPLAAKVHWVG